MSRNASFVSEAENFKLDVTVISLFVNKTSLCSKMNTEAGTHARYQVQAQANRALSWERGISLCFAFSVFAGEKGWE